MNPKSTLQILQFENFIQYSEIIHYSSTRNGGFSSNHLAGLNLGYTVGDNPINVSKNLELLAHKINIDRKQFVFPKQTHSANIGIVKSENDIFNDTDALITNVPGICISVRTADCVPILLYDPVKKSTAAIHSGWKGTVQKISKKVIEIMEKEFGTYPKDIIAGIGPSIGPAVYEVRNDVIDQFKKEFNINSIFQSISSEKSLLNLWESNKQILFEAGVSENNIEIAEMCTYSNPEMFFSARRDGVKCGRMATGIMIKS